MSQLGILTEEQILIAGLKKIPHQISFDFSM
jgi:hypothetical protein